MQPFCSIWSTWYKIAYFSFSCTLYLVRCYLYPFAPDVHDIFLFRFRIAKHKFERRSIGFTFQDVCALERKNDVFNRRIRIYCVHIFCWVTHTSNFLIPNGIVEVFEIWASRFPCYFVISFTREQRCVNNFLFPSLFLASHYWLHHNDLYHGPCARSTIFLGA
jgi:hypothetical protein